MKPVESIWKPHYLSSYRSFFLLQLYAVLPPRFSAALTTYLRSLLLTSTPSAPPQFPLTMGTLLLILDRYDPLLFGLIYEEIEKKVVQDCKGEYSEPKLAGLVEWLSISVMGWVSQLYSKAVEGGVDGAKKMLKPTFSRFEYHVMKTLGGLRTKELFDIIRDYPESKPALEDLKTALVKTDQRTLLVNRLRASLNQRLLHPGADTRDIITLYIATIRSLRIVDPVGVLLSRVADPIRQYLRSREDTIRCIVSSMIEEGNELVAELAATDARPLHDARDEAESFNDPKWTPDPVDAPPDYRKSKGSDIIQMLVSIYDTKDVFVKELQVLLAQRLLVIKDYALDKEIKNVEILKTRFGEQSLLGCEVMLKDLQESKRIDNRVHEVLGETPLHVTIVSRLFWPAFQSTTLKLSGQLAQVQDKYNKTFASLKPDKKLKWLPQLGSVNLTIHLEDRTVTLDATPLQASIIELFNSQDTWTEDDLAIELTFMDSAAVRNALYFWNNHGVIKNVQGDEWKLLEKQDTSADAVVSHVVEMEAEPIQSVDSQQLEQMRVFWRFVEGMLKNLGAQPASRIHSTLGTLVPDYQGRTIDQLESFLEQLQGEGLVQKSGTNWKIVK
ncbi:hypothetical protein T439DRAFT_359225 [Meredithblackwellia eburnea MCA 4105]